MDLRRIRYFLALAEEGHFGRAAERLHIVQPALSMQIKALEGELGGPLFQRTSRKVVLTAAGVLLRARAERMLQQLEQARQEVQRTIRGELGRVRVGFAGNAVFSGKLTQDLRTFRTAFPDVELVVREVPPQLQVEALQSDELDIGYAPSHGLVLPPSLLSEEVGSWSMVAAMRSDHPLAAKKLLTVKMIAAETLIVYAGHETNDTIEVILRQLFGHEPNVAYRVGNTLGVLALAAAGLGLALVPAPVKAVVLPDLIYKKLDAPSLKADLQLISRRQETSGAVIAFLNLASKS